MSRRVFLLPSLLLLQFLVVASPLRAQGLSAVLAPNAPGTQSAPGAQNDSKAKDPTIIALADIQDRADADERLAETVIVQSRQRSVAGNLGPRLEAIRQSVDEKLKLFQSDAIRMLPVKRIESLERDWNFDARQFDRWRSDFKSASAPYTEQAAQIAQRRADWQATQAAAEAGSMPEALSNRIVSVVEQLKAAEGALSVRLQNYIELGRRANTLQADISTGQASVADAIGYIDSRLLRIDAPPLWALGNAKRAPGTSPGAAEMGLDIELRFLKRYGASTGDNQHLLSLLELAMLPLLFWLGRKYRRHHLQHADVADTAGEDPQITAAARVLRRPFSTWLLLSMMGVLVFESEAPILLQQSVMLIALVPALRLLPARVYRLLGPWPYIAAGLYVLQRLGFLFLSNELLYRWYFLAVTLLTLSLTLWLLWRSHHRNGETNLHGKARSVVHLIAWASVVLMAVSAIANIVGNISLAEMLTSALLDSGYFGLMLYAGVAVFLALMRLTLTLSGMQKFRIVRGHSEPILKLSGRLLSVATLAGWLVFTANSFRIFRPSYAFFASILTHEFAIGEVTISLWNVLLFLLSVFIAFWTAKTVRFVLEEEVLPNMSLPRGVGNSIASLAYYALIMLGLLFALAAAGFQVSQLAFMLGALGVGIGLGLQDVVKNFVSGLILMFERPIQLGDTVDVTGTAGRVHEIGMRATILKTFDGADVVVPNGTLLSEKITNWTLRDMNRRVEVEVGVAYGSDPDQVLDVLMGAIHSTPKVSTFPEPTVLFSGFGASSLGFSVRAWTSDFDSWTVIRSDLMSRIYKALNEAGIEIPFPQTDLHVPGLAEEIARLLPPQGGEVAKQPASAPTDAPHGRPASRRTKPGEPKPD